MAPLDLLATYVAGGSTMPMFTEVPRDNRIRLIYEMPGFVADEKLPFPSLLSHNTYFNKNFRKLIKWIGDMLDRESHDDSWHDLRIMDHVKTSSSNPEQIMYRMGDPPRSYIAYENAAEVPTSSTNYWQALVPVAPWRRIILCRGISTLLQPNGKFTDQTAQDALPCIDMFPDWLPFEDSGSWASDVTNESIIEAIKLHMSCSSRMEGDQINPYLDASRSFHITFYEVLGEKENLGGVNTFPSDSRNARRQAKIDRRLQEESWKTGHLYIDPSLSWGQKGPIFRRSAFTTLVATENLDSTAEKARRPDLSPEWGTMLVLCPSLTSHWCDSPVDRPEDISKTWKTILAYKKIRVGEIAVLKEEYTVILHRWSQLMKHINSLLQENWMDPESYVKLIFDDDQLSTSKKYFWLLACIPEFRTHIMDNILQWNLYRAARITPFPYSREREVLFLTRHIEESCKALDVIRREMDEILEKVKARRDGLFNASALSESRNSNRLGQNVKLLTYVSIFYLPLAFCAALWAIPNINMSGTRTAFIVTSVVLGLVNLVVVANLNNIFRTLGNTYNIWRSRIVQEMKDDCDEMWHQNGQRLDDSWPASSTAPSEWLVWLYPVSKIAKSYGIGGRYKPTHVDHGLNSIDIDDPVNFKWTRQTAETGWTGEGNIISLPVREGEGNLNNDIQLDALSQV